ncbi:pseudouridine synthase, partial [Enterococcus casseliflavus]|uniref:pseudouridine synthase n=1 Tax=Enterococcus casseliflavus TaxID=37734 RepID=UPI003D0A650C
LDMSDSAPLSLLHLDDHLLVVAKPAGLLAHASRIAADVDVDLLEQLRAQFGAEVNLVHRLDRATSGLVLAARTREAASALGKQ